MYQELCFLFLTFVCTVHHSNAGTEFSRQQESIQKYWNSSTAISRKESTQWNGNTAFSRKVSFQVKTKYHFKTVHKRKHLFVTDRILRHEDKLEGRSSMTEVGQPLFLTPYIESGRIEEGRLLAMVTPFTDAPQVQGYAGFITVNKAFESNLFFWFFKSETRKIGAPLLVWLQGGPGGSSMYGLFRENGPYVIGKDKISQRKTYWSQQFNVIYIDQPVGTGFSFANEDGYAQNQTVVGRDLYNFMLQFLTLFPEYKDNKFYITGESYAGKYIPAFAHRIHLENQKLNRSLKINLSGLFIGNAWSDPVNMLKYGDNLYQLGLIDSNGRKHFNRFESYAASLIQEEEWEKAADVLDSIADGNNTLFHNYTGLPNPYNHLDSEPYEWLKYQLQFLNSDFFRSSVHVGDLPFTEGGLVFEKLKQDIPKSIIGWIVELLDHYPIIFYTGQLDCVCAYPLIENVLKVMKWSHSEEYKHARRYMYKIKNQVAGYYKNVGNLTEILIRNAGHMVPTDQPEWTLQMLLSFMNK